MRSAGDDAPSIMGLDTRSALVRWRRQTPTARYVLNKRRLSLSVHTARFGMLCGELFLQRRVGVTNIRLAPQAVPKEEMISPELTAEFNEIEMVRSLNLRSEHE